jgi:peptidoglycan/LPS O-acetylase OafA/YrhL
MRDEEKPDLPSRTHQPQLDGLRGLAVLLVLAHNLSIIETSDTLLQKLWTFFVGAGWIGVQLFFVLSGYLITGILLDERGRPRQLRDFYVRRALRIFPLYYAFLAVRLLLLPRFFPAMHVPAASAAGFWLYASNWTDLLLGPVANLGHLWSLAVEEQFYLVWPWLTLLPRRTFGRACLVILVGSFVARIAFLRAGLPGTWLYVSTITRADALAMGALVALALRDATQRARLSRALRPLAAFGLLALLVVVARSHGLSRMNLGVQTYGYSALALLFALLLADLGLVPGRAYGRVLSNGPLRRVGTYSYGMYVLHIPLKGVVLALASARLEAAVRAHPVGFDVAFVIALTLLTMGLAAVSYVVLERPFLSLKERWAPR